MTEGGPKVEVGRVRRPDAKGVVGSADPTYVCDVSVPGSPATDANPRHHLAFALIFLGALAIRCLYLWGQARHNPLFDAPILDAGFHHEWAKQISAGEGLGDRPFFRAPLYYHLLGVLYRLCGPSVMAARLMGCVLGAGTCYLVARLGATLAGFRTGVIAGVLAALYWPFIYFDGELLSVGLELFLDVALLLLMVWAQRRGSPGLFFLSGMVWGLSALTRPNILALALALAVWPFLVAPVGDRVRQLLRSLVPACAGLALAIFPVTIRNYVVGGELALIATNGGVNFYIGNNARADGLSAVLPGAEEGWGGGSQQPRRIAERALGRVLRDSEVSDYWYSEAFAWIRSEPLRFAHLMLHKLRLFWTPFELLNNQPIRFFARMSEVSVIFWLGFGVIVPLAAGGVWVVRQQWRVWYLPMTFLVIYMTTVVVFFCPARYRLPVVPVLILLAAAGLEGITRRVGEWKSRDGVQKVAAGGCGSPLPYGRGSVGRRRFAHGRLDGAAVYLGICAGVALFMVGAGLGAEAVRTNDEAEGHLLLGNHYATATSAGDVDEEQAVHHLRQAIALGQRSPAPRVRLAEVLMRQECPEEAGELLARAAADYPDDPRVRVHYGRFLSARGRHAQAVEQYRKALVAHPSYLTARVLLGVALAKQGQGKAVIRQYEEALRRDPAQLVAHQCLAAVLAEQGRFAGAADRVSEALRLAQISGRPALAKELQRQLRLYEQQQPYSP